MRGVLKFVAFAACVAVPSLASAQEAVSDPWERTNRNLFAIHEGVDQAVLEPVARGYRAVTPTPVRQGVRNVLRNLRGPVIFANDVLQGEFGRAGTTAARFGINTTIGIAGLFDPATTVGFERHDEDFGQTLAVWGVDAGPYIFVPLLGPTNVRDASGRFVDMAFDPLQWAEGDDIPLARGVRGAMTGVSAREQVLETVDDIRANSIDPYATIRTSYALLRASAIQNGRADVQDLPDFDDIPETQEPLPETQGTPSGGGDALASPPTDENNIGDTYVMNDEAGDAQ